MKTQQLEKAERLSIANLVLVKIRTQPLLKLIFGKLGIWSTVPLSDEVFV